MLQPYNALQSQTCLDLIYVTFSNILSMVVTLSDSKKGLIGDLYEA